MKTILIVDDKLSAQRLVADYLAENGFRTVVASNAVRRCMWRGTRSLTWCCWTL